MKRRLKTWWVRRPRPRRGYRLVLNIVLSAVLLTWLWGMAGYPLPTAEMEFRRLERVDLYPASEIVFHLESGRKWIAGSTVQIGDVYVGVAGNQAVAGYLMGPGTDGGSYLDVWPLNEGPSPVPLSIPVAQADAVGQLTTGNALLFLHTPEQAALAELSVTGWGAPGRVETVRGERRTNGVLYLWLGPEHIDASGHARTGGRALEGLPYTLKLFREDGTLLERWEGTIPQTA